jgi:hypothetical protein
VFHRIKQNTIITLYNILEVISCSRLENFWGHPKQQMKYKKHVKPYYVTTAIKDFRKKRYYQHGVPTNVFRALCPSPLSNMQADPKVPKLDYTRIINKNITCLQNDTLSQILQQQSFYSLFRQKSVYSYNFMNRISLTGIWHTCMYLAAGKKIKYLVP